MGHEIDEIGNKPRENNGSDTKDKTTGKYKTPEIISRGDTIQGKISTETFGTDRPTEKIGKEKRTMDMVKITTNGF